MASGLASFLGRRNVVAPAITVSTIQGSSIATTSITTGALSLSTLTGSTINASSITFSSLTGSTITTSTITSNMLTLSTLTVSSINSGAPGVAAYSTFNASSINTSSITASSITTASGYNSNIGNVLYTSLADSGQTAANLITTGMPGTAPTGSVISGSYRLTAGASAGAAVMRLAYTFVVGTTYNFTFTGMQGSQALALYVYQYNSAGTASIQISASVYSITTSTATVSGSFTPNASGTYTGTIVFYFQAAAVNQYVNFTAFSMNTGAMNVGIGTSVPSENLTVYGSGVGLRNATAGYFQIGIASGSGQYSSSAVSADSIIRAMSGNLMIQTGSGAAGIYINSSNYVGIGTTNPGAILQVYNGAVSYTIPTVSISDGAADNGGAYGMVNLTRPLAPGDYKAHIAMISSGNKVGLLGYLNNTTTMGWVSANSMNSSNGIFLNGSGYVGIGTTNPTASLHVFTSTTDTTSGVLSSRFFLTNPGDNQDTSGTNYDGPWYGLGWSGISGLSGNPYVCLAGNAGVAMRSSSGFIQLTGAGQVGIGKTNPGYLLDVAGDVRATGSLIIGTGGTYTPGCIFANVDWGMILRTYTASPIVSKFVVTDAADTHLFGVDLNNRMYIGKTLVGTTTRNSGIARLTINASYNDSASGFAINASDTGSATDDYTMKLYPYVVAGGIVGYAFGTLNGSTNYTPLSFNRNLVGINNTSPGSALSVLGGQIMVETGTAGNEAEYVSPTPGLHIRGNGSGTAQMILETRGIMTAGIAANSAGINIQAQSGSSVLLKYGVAYNGDYSGGSTGLQVNGSGVVLMPSQPYVLLGTGGTDNSIAYNSQGACFGYSGYSAYLTPYQSVGFTNTTGNGWVPYYGTFTAPWTGRYQINITFYWNSFTAGNRWSLNLHNSAGTRYYFKYCCIEGGGIAADTIRSYGTTAYMTAGDYFQITLSSYVGGSCNAYFGGETHSSMTVVFLG